MTAVQAAKGAVRLRTLVSAGVVTTAVACVADTSLERVTKARQSSIVVLSRRNTNVQSLALSLNQKRLVTAACDDSLRALGAALAKRGFAATR